VNGLDEVEHEQGARSKGGANIVEGVDRGREEGGGGRHTHINTVQREEKSGHPGLKSSRGWKASSLKK
jgi:hypothetical protein